MMTRRNIVYIAGSLFIALFVIIYGISTMPSRLLKERNDAYLKMAGGYNVFLHLPRADARWDTFVSPSPDLMYSVLVFDTGEHPLVVEFPPYPGYWVNQMVAENTDSFAYIGNRTEGDRGVKILLYSDATPAFEDPGEVTMFKTPSVTGTFLLRYLIKSDDDVKKIEEIRSTIRAYSYMDTSK
jgi:hypothetical protein